MMMMEKIRIGIRKRRSKNNFQLSKKLQISPKKDKLYKRNETRPNFSKLILVKDSRRQINYVI